MKAFVSTIDIRPQPPFGGGNEDEAEDEVLYNAASMEPPPFGGGNSVLGTRRDQASLLQWSHPLSAVEIMASATRRAQHIGASMEPPPFGGGNHDMAYKGAVSDALLQWSHPLSAVEISDTMIGTSTLTPLQWSHPLSAVEIRTVIT